jgi:hypothetical protein
MAPTPQYLVKYNNYVLPGYAQQESFDNQMNLASHYGAYIDGSPTEETGLQNKALNLRMKVWDCDYLTAKNQVELAATMLRSKRDAWAELYVQYTDRHYDAKVKTIQTEKSVPSSVKILEYDAFFECRPWLIGNDTKTITGTGTIDTDQVTRTIADGGWSPTILTITGTDVTVSGYTVNGDFTGFLSVAGAVTNLVVDTEAFTATIGGINANGQILSTDYRLHIGPEKTFFDITGASSATIEYQNRWYI